MKRVFFSGILTRRKFAVFFFSFYLSVLGFLLLLLFTFSLKAQEPKLILPIGHSGAINSINFSPDGKKIITASSDETVKIWDMESGALLADLRGNKATVVSAVYSRDGKRILANLSDRTVKSWDAQTGAPLFELNGPENRILSSEFSPGGKKVLTAPGNNTAEIWDAQMGVPKVNLHRHSNWLDSALIGKIGNTLGQTSFGLLTRDGIFYRWDIRTGTLPDEIMTSGTWSRVSLGTASPDNKRAVKLQGNHIAEILDKESGKLLAGLKGHTDMINSALFSPDGKKVVTASADSTAKIWDVQSGRLLANMNERDGELILAMFISNGKAILTLTANGSAKIWNAESGAVQTDLGPEAERSRITQIGFTAPTFSPDGKEVFIPGGFEPGKLLDTQNGDILTELKRDQEHDGYVIFSPDGTKFVTHSRNGMYKIWDVRLNSVLAVLIDTIDDSYVLPKFSQDGKKLLTAFDSHEVKVWNVVNGALMADLKVGVPGFGSAEFSQDATRILTNAKGQAAKLWDAQNGALLFDLKSNKNQIGQTIFSPDGKKILTQFEDTGIKIWDALNGVPLVNWDIPNEQIDSVLFSPDGKRVVTRSHRKGNMYSDQEGVKIWNAGNGSLMAELKGHASPISSIVLSPDGKRMVTFSFIGLRSPNLWDVQSGTLIAKLKGTETEINEVKFSADGKRILTASNDWTAKIWDAQTGKFISMVGHSLGGAYSNHIPYAISPDGKLAVVPFLDSTVNVWDAQTGNLLHKLKGIKGQLESAVFTPDEKDILTTSSLTAWRTHVQLWNAANGNLLNDFSASKNGYQSVIVSADGKKILTVLSDDTAKVWDVVSGKIQASLTGEKCGFSSAVFSNHGNKILTMSTAGIAKLWDAAGGTLIADLKIDTNKYRFITIFSPDEQKVITGSEYNGNPYVVAAEYLDGYSRYIPSEIEIWETVNGARLGKLNGFKGSLRSADFSPDSKKIAAIGPDFAAETWDVQACVMLADKKEYIKGVNSVDFYPDSKFVISTDPDGFAKVWDSQTGKLVYTFFAVDSTDYFAQLPTGYYMATPNAAKLLHYVTKNLEVISFEQLDIKYNRPDKVLEAIGCPDTALIRSYKRAYEKRIKRLGIDTTTFKSGYSVPKSDFFNRDEIEQQASKKDRLSLHITGIDSSYNLDRFNVWVNKVPVYGIRGISLKKRNMHTLDKTIAITLSQGNNRIETSVTDANGTESYHIPLNVKYTPSKPVDTLLHFIGIGIDHFSDSKYNLNWSVKDVHELAAKFKEKYGEKSRIHTLFDARVTKDSVIALKKILLKTGVNDKVIIAYSGHGLLSKDYDYYLSGFNVNFDKPEQGGIPYDVLENLLDSIPARKKLMLIDACNSGEVDKEELARYNFAEAGLDSTGVHKGVKMLIDPNHKMGMKSSFELMKDLFVNVGKSTGATIISAAGGTQFALEKGDLKNGVFTYSILEYLRQPHCTIAALKQYVNKRVVELTAGMQAPTTRNDTDVVDWEVW